MEGEGEVPCGNDQGEHRIKAKETMNGKTRAEPGRVSNPGDEGDSRAPDTVPLRKARNYPKIQQENPATDESCSLVWEKDFPFSSGPQQGSNPVWKHRFLYPPYPISQIPNPISQIPYPISQMPPSQRNSCCYGEWRHQFQPTFPRDFLAPVISSAPCPSLGSVLLKFHYFGNNNQVSALA